MRMRTITNSGQDQLKFGLNATVVLLSMELDHQKMQALIMAMENYWSKWYTKSCFRRRLQRYE